MKSGNLNFLEPYGPLQACNGTHLSLPLTFTSPLYRYVSVHRNSLVICLPVSPVPIKVVSFRSSSKGGTTLHPPCYTTDRLLCLHIVSTRDIDGKWLINFKIYIIFLLEFYVPTFRNTLFDLHRWCKQEEKPGYSSCLHHLWRWNWQSVPKCWHLKFMLRGIT